MDNEQEKTLFDYTYQELFLAIRFHLREDIEGLIETFLCSQQWYRKRKGGKWQLICHNKDIHWSPENCFVDVMADFGQIVDVIKTEDWDVDKN